MKPTIEELLAVAEASVVAVTTERDEIRVSFEKLASEQVAALEGAKTEVAAKDAKLNELTVAIDGETLEVWAPTQAQDRLVDRKASAYFAATAPATVVQTQCFEGMYHEIFNDLYRAQVFNALKRWLLARFSA